MPLSLVTAAWAAWGAAYLPSGKSRSTRELTAAVVKLSIRVQKNARTAETLGEEREGTGVVIDAHGLVLTIGYLLLEAESILVVTHDGRILPGNVAGFDHASGFGLVRTSQPLETPAFEFGDVTHARELTGAAIVTHADAGGLSKVCVVGRRAFAGWWEYALDNAIFTAPARDRHSGAALIDATGKLIGIGSLWVGDAIEAGAAFPGNMFVPIDELTPILADLKSHGRRSGKARPWLGLYTEAVRGHLIITQVLRDSPAEKSGLKRGDVILAVGSMPVGKQLEFYKALWQRGPAGIPITLQIWRDESAYEIVVRSTDRMDYLRPWTTLAA